MAVGTSKRAVDFVPDPRRTFGYRLARVIFEALAGIWFRPVVTGRANIPSEGPVILAPVHRSFVDFGFTAFVTDRKLFFMAKDELWENRLLGRLLVSLGVFPVRRQAADRQALRRAEEVLNLGQVLVLFPEGTRQVGDTVAPLLEGAAFLAARTGAVIVPIGIGGSDQAMPKGKKLPRPISIRVVVGEAMAPSARAESGRVARSRVHGGTEELRRRIQQVYDQARRSRHQVRRMTEA